MIDEMTAAELTRMRNDYFWDGAHQYPHHVQLVRRLLTQIDMLSNSVKEHRYANAELSDQIGEYQQERAALVARLTAMERERDALREALHSNDLYEICPVCNSRMDVEDDYSFTCYSCGHKLQTRRHPATRNGTA